MQPINREFTFLTSAFPHGAYQSLGANHPELRPPSIKGQLRWWYDALFSDRASEDQLFGGLKNSAPRSKPGPESSRVILRLQELGGPAISKTTFMPHKGQSGGEKNAIPPGTRYRLSIISRRDGITPELETRLKRTLDAWFLLGAVGQRANRGAGSIGCDNAPASSADYEAAASAILAHTRLRAVVLTKAYETERALRFDAGDFLAAEAFGPSTPFGSAFPRKPSLLKLRAARIDGALHLVALWDGRHQADLSLREGIETLKNHPKEIGRLLSSAVARLCDSVLGEKTVTHIGKTNTRVDLT